MNTVVLLACTGLGLGALYFLVASGLSLIFGLMDVLNFAHGALLSAGAYAAWWAAVEGGMGFWSAVLFGTVVGIINAFRGIAATGSGGMAAVSGGIAEALVATALGIFVAIPAVVAFNNFTGKLENFHVAMNQASSELVNYLFHVPRPESMPYGRHSAAAESYAAQSATVAQSAVHAAR